MITDELLYANAPQARDIWLTALPSDGDTPEHHFSRGFRRKMQQLIRTQRRSPGANKAIMYMKRAVAMFIAVIAISSSVLLSVEASREKIVEVIVNIFHELTEFRFNSETEEAPMPEILFTYVPEGMTEVENEGNQSTVFITYEDPAGKQVRLWASNLTTNSNQTSIVDTEGALKETIVIHGEEASFYTKTKYENITIVHIIWIEQNVVYQLSGTVHPNEMKKVAENLKIIYK